MQQPNFQQPPKFGPGLAAGAMSGTLLEWYEAWLFAVGARYVGNAFFPSKEPIVSLLSTFIVFAIGFAARPFGAIFWGWVGDRRGRSHVMLWTLSLGGIATVLIGFVPNYASIGIAAPILVALLRIVQGFSLGGEWGGAVNYIFENLRRRRRLLLSLVQSTVALGLLLAAAVFLVLESVMGTAATASWGWRIAYWLAAIVVVVGLLFRLRFGETLEYIEAKLAEKSPRNPLREVFTKYLFGTIVSIVLAGAAGAVFYYGNTFAPNLARSLNAVTSQEQFLAVIAFAVVEFFGVLLSGVLAESIGPRATIIAGNVLSLAPIALIGMILNGFQGLLTVAVLAGLAHGIIYTAEAAYIAELYPTLARTTGLSVAYQFGNAIFAATAPSIMTVLYRGYGLYVASLYVAALSVLTVILVAAYRRR
ncbi:MAG: MFS transporter [Thermoproteus sp.]